MERGGEGLPRRSKLKRRNNSFAAFFRGGGGGGDDIVGLDWDFVDWIGLDWIGLEDECGVRWMGRVCMILVCVGGFFGLCVRGGFFF